MLIMADPTTILTVSSTVLGSSWRVKFSKPSSNSSSSREKGIGFLVSSTANVTISGGVLSTMKSVSAGDYFVALNLKRIMIRYRHVLVQGVSLIIT